MAQRPIYIPQTKGDYLVQTDMLDFKWFPGMAISQKQKSILSNEGLFLLQEMTLSTNPKIAYFLQKLYCFGIHIPH